MAKAVEISFAIGAALTGGFTGAFGKAGQMLNQLQQQSSKLSQVTGQVSGYQKMEASITANQAAMTQAREQAKALETQITSSAQRTAQLQSQYRNSQAEIERLNAVLVRNKDAYEAARLKADSLKSQIQSSTGPTTELQRQYQAAQQEVRRLGDQVKQSSTQLKAAKDVSKQLGSEMKQSASQTKQLQREQKTLNDNAEKLQSGIKRDTEELAKMRSELSGAGVDTKNLAQEQARLEAQSQKAAAAQKKLADAQANYKSIKDQLSFSNIKNDLIASAGIMYSMYKPVMAAANFDEAMSGVKAVAFTGKDRTPEEAARSQAEFAQLREQALQLGADTQFTAIQAANSQENLARAGFKTKEIMAAMPPLLNMAAAEGMDLATAADIAASTLRGFNLDAEQTAHVADVLAQTSAASNTSIQGLGESMKYVAPVAAGLGISVEQTAAMLGIMGNAGIKGSQAGTALRAALTRLSKEPKKVADSLAELGVRAKDSQGRLRTMPSLMEELRQKLNGMGEGRQMQYLANIFGTEAAAGMLAIMRSTADGTLSELEYANKEASGIMKVLLDDVNKGLDKPIVTLEEMRAGMQKSEDQAKKLGISYNELASYLTVLAKQGIKGANADKALTTAFTQLQKQPKAMKQAFKKYNISAYTEGGMLKDFPDLLNEINKSMAGMKEADQLKALTQIFGKGTAESIRALMQGISDNSLDELKKKAEGVSEKMAKIRLDNLKGDLTILDSAWSGLQISVGKIFEPLAREGVQLLTTAISGLNETIKKFPKASKGIAYVIASLGALKVAKTVWKIGSALVRLPGAWLKVAGAAAEANAVLGKSTIIQKAWHGVMKAGSKLLDVGKLVLYYGKQILITTATKAWAAALKVWRIAMWAGSKLLSPVKLILYYSKQLLITTATKAWTAAQWLWNAALNANPIGLLITAIAGAIAIGYAMYKNWDKIKAWWNSWKVKDIFAVIKDYASQAWNYAKELWNDFWAWWDSLELGDLFSPVKEFASGAYDWVKAKWEEFKSWWNSWTLEDIFPSVKEYAASAKDYVLSKWESFKSWWDSWTLADIFPSVKEYAGSAKDYVLNKWQDFSNWWQSWTLEDVFAIAKDYAGSAKDFTLSKWEEFLTWWDSLNLKDVFEIVSGYAEIAQGYVSSKWQEFQLWWESITLSDLFAPIVQFAIEKIEQLRGLFMNFCNWLKDLFAKLNPFNWQMPAWLGGGKAGDNQVKNSERALNSWGIPNIGKRALGGFINRPEVSLIGEAGREVVVPLENRARGIPLWKAAGEELGFSFGNSTTTNNNRNVTMSPNINITVNGGDGNTAQKFRQIVEDVLSDLQDQERRLSFA